MAASSGAESCSSVTSRSISSNVANRVRARRPNLLLEVIIAAFEANRIKAEELGARMRPVDVKSAKRTLAGSRTSDGWGVLASKGRLDLSLEALVVDKRFTALFTDEEANEALNRLLDAGFYRF